MVQIGWPKQISVSALIYSRYLYQAYILLFSTIFTIVLAPIIIIYLLWAFILTFVEFVHEILEKITLSVERTAVAGDLTREFFGINPGLAPTGIGEAIGAMIGAISIVLLTIPILYAIWKIERAARDDSLIAIFLIFPIIWLSSVIFVLTTIDAQETQEHFLRDPDNIITFMWYGILYLFCAFHFLCAASLRIFPTVRALIRAPRVNGRVFLSRYARHQSALKRALAAAGPDLLKYLQRCLLIASASLLPVLAWAYVAQDKGREAFNFWYFLAVFSISTVAVAYDVWKHKAYRVWTIIFYFLLALSLLDAFDPDRDAATSAANISVLLFFLSLGIRRWLHAPLRSAVATFRRQLWLTASESLARSGKKPVLFLRSFADDHTSVAISSRALSFAFGATSNRMPLEDVVSDAVFAVGPLIAVTDPRLTDAAESGALRQSMTQENWHSDLAAVMDDSSLIICLLGTTEGLKWEMDQIMERGRAHDTILVLPPDYPEHGTLSTLCPAFAAHIGIGSEKIERARGHGVRAIGYDADRARWVMYSAMATSQRSYSTCIRIATQMALGREFRRAERPILHKLKPQHGTA